MKRNREMTVGRAWKTVGSCGRQAYGNSDAMGAPHLQDKRKT